MNENQSLGDQQLPQSGTGSSSLGPGASLKRAANLVAEHSGGIDYAALRALVPISAVLQLLEFRPSARLGKQLRGPCPIHGASSPLSRSFSVNLSRNVFRCFSGKCRAQGNQLDLWALTQNLPLHAASILLAERLGIEVPRLVRRGSGRRDLRTSHGPEKRNP